MRSLERSDPAHLRIHILPVQHCLRVFRPRIAINHQTGRMGGLSLSLPSYSFAKANHFFCKEINFSAAHTCRTRPHWPTCKDSAAARARLQIANVSRRKSQMSSRLTLRYHRYRGFGFCLRDGVNVLGATVNGLKKRKVCAAWCMVLGFWGTLFGYWGASRGNGDGCSQNSVKFKRWAPESHREIIVDYSSELFLKLFKILEMFLRKHDS